LRVTVFGATGAIGRRVVEAALEAGHDVITFTRDPSKLGDLEDRVTIVTGDAESRDDVDRALLGADAVVNALGPSTNKPAEVRRTTRAIRNILSAMELHGVRRLVSLGGAAITARDEKKPLSGRVTSAVVRLLARHVVAAKQAEYEILVTSSVDWTVVRPPRVIDGPATGHYIAGDTLAGRSITRGDLARFMVDQIEDPSYLRAAPYVSA
jgi:putative NADH-flavin reductase